MRKLLVLLAALGFSVAANAALSPALTAVISSLTTTLLSMWQALLLAGLALWAASLIAARFGVNTSAPGASTRWNTYRFEDGSHVHRERVSKNGGRSFDAVDDSSGRRTYTYRD